jgi:hypothetical protein
MTVIGPGREHPMSQRSSGSAGPGSDDWPDDLWPDDDDQPGGRGGQTGGGGRGGPQPALPGSPGGPEGGPPERRPRPAALLLVIALVAAAAGAGTVLAVDAFSGSSGATPGSASRPASLTPVPPGGGRQPGGNGARPGTGSGGTGTLFVIGKVTAVNSRSITIGGPAHTVTAAVTSSTRVTGSVSGIGAVKVGDQISAQIVQNGGRATATAIQDPAQSPLGGNAP